MRRGHGGHTSCGRCRDAFLPGSRGNPRETILPRVSDQWMASSEKSPLTHHAPVEARASRSTWWRCAHGIVSAVQRSDWREAAWVHFGAEFHGLIAVVVRPACQPVYSSGVKYVSASRARPFGGICGKTPGLSGFSPFSLCQKRGKDTGCHQLKGAGRIVRVVI